jgi:uncharacterized LabA/DUF88 family protein
MNRVAIFVDAGNMFYAQKEMGWWIDWRRVFEYFTNNCELYGAYYFTATPPAERSEQLKKYRGYKNFLIKTGYKVIDKEVRVITDSVTGKTKLKGNLDVELVFNMMVSPDQWDEAVVFGCDVDYEPIFIHLRNIGKRIKVVGFNKMTSLDLINSASDYIELSDIKHKIGKIP